MADRPPVVSFPFAVLAGQRPEHVPYPDQASVLTLVNVAHAPTG
ncbi:hypothetical protein QTA57_11525 [Fontisubflavum oceani]|nr:hypothetical protein [Fontisubflavum oceani]WJY20483.1 hypothetical protein QTA57_11525 [Fontisubflavum oceani]